MSENNEKDQPDQLKQLKHSEVKELRESILFDDQNAICPLCGNLIYPEDAALDHDHDTGQIRGVLHNVCNSYEGMVKHKFVRSGAHKKTSLINYLSNLIEYLQKEQYPILHPNEIPRPRKIKKASYNKLLKLHQKSKMKKRFPSYPKSKKMINGLKYWYDFFDLEPEYYKER